MLSAILINYMIPTTVTLEDIQDTVVGVNDSSGVIIQSDDKHTLVLTDYHVVWRMVDENGNYKGDEKPKVLFKYVYKDQDKNFHTTTIYYECKEIYIDKSVDLAILRIDTGVKLNYSKINMKKLDIGDDIYIVGNPNGNYRSVVKGILSSKDRYYNNSPMLQISGGVTYGTSGGGAFTMDGQLVGLARLVDLRKTDFCTSVKFFDIEYPDCYIETIPYMGFFTPPEIIRDFILSTKFKDKFDYLK